MPCTSQPSGRWRLTRRRRLLLTLPLLAVVAACGSTAQVSSTRSTGDGLGALPGTPDAPLVVPDTQQSREAGAAPSDGTPVADAPTRGAAVGQGQPVLPSAGPDRSPIEIGVLGVGDASAFVSSFGFSSSSGPTGQQMVRALVSWFDAHGGIAGKQIKLVEYDADPSATSYETEMSAACATFTQDHHVAVVMSNTGYQMSDNYETCLTKAGVPDLNNGVGGLDDATLARHPQLFLTSASSVDASLTAELRGLTANGFLTSKSRIGVLVEGCPFDVAAYDRTLAPLAKRLGLDVQRRDFDCVLGAGTMPQAIGQISAAVLPFAAAGVDRVLFVSNYQGAGAVFFEKQAASQGYKPWYGLTSYSGAGPSAAEIGEDAQKRIKGVGWSPDLDNGQRPAATGARRRCWTVMASAHLTLSGTSFITADQLCGAFFALEAALQRTQGHADARSLVAGLETTSASPVVLGGSLALTSLRHDAGSLFAPFGHSVACGCFIYTGKPFRPAP